MANKTRNVFFDKIYNLMKKDEDIVIISVDLAGPPFDRIRKDFPDRYIGVGIAEQNAIAVACGLCSVGKKAIVYASNPFSLFRGFDQIRNCVCMMKLPVIIVGLGTGFSLSDCGSTHFVIEDITLAATCAACYAAMALACGVIPFVAAVTVKRFSDFFEATGFVYGTLMAILVFIAL